MLGQITESDYLASLKPPKPPVLEKTADCGANAAHTYMNIIETEPFPKSGKLIQRMQTKQEFRDLQQIQQQTGIKQVFSQFLHKLQSDRNTSDKSRDEIAHIFNSVESQSTLDLLRLNRYRMSKLNEMLDSGEQSVCDF
jgi:hypothetical protein